MLLSTDGLGMQICKYLNDVKMSNKKIKSKNSEFCLFSESQWDPKQHWNPLNFIECTKTLQF